MAFDQTSKRKRQINPKFDDASGKAGYDGIYDGVPFKKSKYGKRRNQSEFYSDLKNLDDKSDRKLFDQIVSYAGSSAPDILGLMCGSVFFLDSVYLDFIQYCAENFALFRTNIREFLPGIFKHADQSDKDDAAGDIFRQTVHGICDQIMHIIETVAHLSFSEKYDTIDFVETVHEIKHQFDRLEYLLKESEISLLVEDYNTVKTRLFIYQVFFDINADADQKYFYCVEMVLACLNFRHSDYYTITEDRATSLIVSNFGWLDLANQNKNNADIILHDTLNVYSRGIDVMIDLDKISHIKIDKNNEDFTRKTPDKIFKKWNTDTHRDEAIAAADVDRIELVEKPQESGPGMVVIRHMPPDYGTNGRAVNDAYRQFLRIEIPLNQPPDLVEVRQKLLSEFPQALSVIDVLLNDIAARRDEVGRPYLYFRPTILVGAPGSGKSYFTTRFADALDLPNILFSCAGVHDSMFGSSSKKWGNGQPSVPLQAIASNRIANPLIILDELEKSGTGTNNGRLHDVLLPMLEHSTASKLNDDFIGGPIDISRINFLATVNSLDSLSATLKNRFRILHFDTPGHSHLEKIVPGLIKSISSDRGLNKKWIAALSAGEIDMIKSVWSGGSIRSLRRIVETVIDAREGDPKDIVYS